MTVRKTMETETPCGLKRYRVCSDAANEASRVPRGALGGLWVLGSYERAYR
jgi:hypothetical protein